MALNFAVILQTTHNVAWRVYLIQRHYLQRKLVEVRDTQRRDEQLKYLKWATSAVEDIQGRKYEVGHTENVSELSSTSICSMNDAVHPLARNEKLGGCCPKFACGAPSSVQSLRS